MRLRPDVHYRKLSRQERRESKKKKYVALRDVRQKTIIRPRRRIASPDGLVVLDPSGWLTIKTGFRWDGPSGPTFDTPTTMRAALIHDALYLLMRLGLLDARDYRIVADALLYRIMIEDGAWAWRATLWLWAVWAFAESAAAPVIQT